MLKESSTITKSTQEPDLTPSATAQRNTNPGRVLKILQDRITENVYAPGGWLPTERELASELGVNRSAVREALLRLEQNALIERRPGCRPKVTDHAAKPARVGAASRAIAVVMPQHELDHASREIARGVSQVLRSEGVNYRQTLFDVVIHSHEPFMMEQEACEALRNGDACAAIVWPALNPLVLARWRALRDQGYPIVFVDRFDEAMSCDFVGVDNYTAARDAVEYLLELGHTRIAHLTASEAVSAVMDRAAGYRDAMDKAGLHDCQAVWTVPTRHISETGTVIEKGVAEVGLPTAIFAVNDHAAYRCVEHLTAKGIRVPDQVSVIGFDDIDRFSPRAGFLTSVRQPFERIGQQAAHLLIRRLETNHSAPEPYQHKLLPTRVIVRQSCMSVL